MRRLPIEDVNQELSLFPKGDHGLDSKPKRFGRIF